MEIPYGVIGIEGSILRQHGLTCHPVEAAGGREHVALDAGFLGRPRQRERGRVVDGESQIGIEIAQGVVGQGGQMDERVETLQVAGRNVAEVLPDGRDRLRIDPEGAGFEEVGVEPGHLMACFEQQVGQDRPDVAVVPRHQNLHPIPRIVE